MSTGAPDFEALLREALTPVDPPADLAERTLHDFADEARHILPGR